MDSLFKGAKMNKSILDAFDKAEGKEQVPCTEECDYFNFPHLETACVLSEVFSVKQGELCYIFKKKDK